MHRRDRNNCSSNGVSGLSTLSRAGKFSHPSFAGVDNRGPAHIVVQMTLANEGRLLYQMPEGTDIKQFLEVRFIFHIQDDILGMLDLGIREYTLAILAINIHHLIHG